MRIRDLFKKKMCMQIWPNGIIYINGLIYLCIHSFIYAYLFIHSFIWAYSFIHSFIYAYLFIHLFISAYSFI